MMKFYLDTANLASIKKYNAMGLVDGVTTNPSLIVKEGADFKETIQAICKEVYPNPVSAEVTATDYEGMITEGKRNKAFAENVVVKIPMIPEGLRATKTLSKMGIPINMTLIFSANQGLAAAKAGASYLSPFIGRLDDIDQEGMGVIRDLVAIKNAYTRNGSDPSGFKAEILVASIRHPIHVLESAKLGADIGTMPAEVMDKLLMHPLTDIGLKRFDDWNKAKKERPSLTV
jgi:transaldolase